MSDNEDKAKAELTIKVAKRRVVRTAITKDMNKITQQFLTVDANNVLEAKVLLSRLEGHEKQIGEYDEYILLHGTSESAIDKEVETAYGYSSLLSDGVVRLRAQIRAIDAADAASSARSGGAGEKKSPIKTPKLELTKFSGDPLRWEEFWDDFTCSIDSRSDLSVIDKFKILKQALQDEALNVADGYFLTQSNYEEVKAALKDRFGDPQEAIHAHFMALMEKKQVSHDLDELVKLRDSCEAHIRSLVALGVSEDTFGIVFAPLILSKLPKYVRMELNRMNGANRWTLPRIRELLRGEIAARTRSERSFAGGSGKNASDGKGKSDHGQGASPRKPKGTVTALMVQTTKGSKQGGKRRPKSCVFCEGGHDCWNCEKYPTAEARIAQVKGRCFRCFGKDHRASSCQSSRKCYYCEKTNHHSSLCYEKFGYPPSKETSQISQTLNPNAPAFGAETSNTVRDEPLNAKGAPKGIAVLESVVAEVKGTKGSANARIVFDTASSTSLIRRKFSRDIGATPLGDNFTSISGVGERKGKWNRYPMVTLTLQLNDGTSMQLFGREIEVVAAPLQLVPVDLREIKKRMGSLDVSQLGVDKPTEAEIDILLGLNHYNNVMGPEVCRSSNGLVVKSTKVGHILTGYVEGNPWADLVNPEHELLMLERPEKIHDLPDLERFWRLEDIGITDKPDLSDDDMALAAFNKSVRFEDDRYTVKFPFTVEVPEIPANRELALARLRSTYRRLEENPELLTAYNQIFEDQLSKNVIEPAPEDPTGVVHYLPHHAVVTPGKVTTKVRVVFDASAKTSQSNPSLNDSMVRGPVFLNDLCGLLLRFRLPAKAVCTDVEKAFLQIRLDETHRDCTRFYWLRDVKKPPTKCNLLTYRYARVPFGMKASPFLLAATIIHHLRQVGTPRAQEVERSTYMDNVIGGCKDTDEAIGYYRETKAMFSQMSMNLREWYCNDDEFMKAIPECDKGNSAEPSVLGIKWNTADDTIRCCAGKWNEGVVTKRTILQLHASIFDPCGWFSPITVKGKVLMQQLWRDKLSWDDPVGTDAASVWVKIVEDINELPKLQMPRLCSIPLSADGNESLQLHTFCDASSKAFAACVYLRATGDGVSRCDLLFAKVRVAPLKKLTIPKLELMAVVIGCRILTFVENELHLPIQAKFVWSDSMCVIGWLKSQKVTSVFVENRLKELRKRTDVQFNFVKTYDNPADVPTRGMLLSELRKSRLWWHGPSWLIEDKDNWSVPTPSQVLADDEGNVETTNAVREAADDVAETTFDLARFGNLAKLLRVTCYVLKAVALFKRRVQRQTETVNAVNLQAALRFWEKRVQALHYDDLIGSLTAQKEPAGRWKNMARQLGLYVDTDGFLRCRGRFERSPELSPTAKDPKLLPPDNRFTELTIEKFHERVLHSGVKHTLAMIRTQYWIPQGRSRVKSVLLKCRVCRRWTGGPFQVPQVSPLPDFRVGIQRPFATVGIDYIGPLRVKNETEPKAWIALFTCAVTRSVHLELVGSLNATEFLLAFRRFAAIYNCPDCVVSDNAKQFKVADQVFARLWLEVQTAESVRHYADAKGITWRYITEKAPWMGGFYERLVALVKSALKKCIGTWTLSNMELATVIYEVAHVLNTRPLVYSDDDPVDVVITPAHLLFKAGELFPDGDQDYDPELLTNRSSKPSELLTHWKAGQALLRTFWQIWRDQYLLALREHWRPLQDRATSFLPADKGTVVLVKEQLPRGMWKVGRIQELRTSKDGKVRTAVVKLPTGNTIQRPLRLLYPLENSCDDHPAQPGIAANATQAAAGDPPDQPARRPIRAAAQAATARIRQQVQDD